MKLSSSIITNILVAIFLTSIPVALEAYSFGAGSCLTGQAGTGPPHAKNNPPTYDTQVITGTLKTGGFTVSIDGTALTAGATFKAAMKKNHVVTVKGGSFRGFSIHLDVPISTGLVPVSGDSNTQINVYCPGSQAVGITHTNKNTKTSAKGNMILTSAHTKVPLDVTIVVQNHGGISIYYYSQYFVTFA
jgi:hypothetical protein